MYLKHVAVLADLTSAVLTGKKVSGYTDTGVTLIAAKPIAGVESKDTTVGHDLCWGKK